LLNLTTGKSAGSFTGISAVWLLENATQQTAEKRRALTSCSQRPLGGSTRGTCASGRENHVIGGMYVARKPNMHGPPVPG
jgi:hypothetical protein